MPAVQIELDEFLRMSASATIVSTTPGFALLRFPAPAERAEPETRLDEWLESDTRRADSLIFH